MARSLSSPRMASSNILATLLSSRYIARTYRADISRRYIPRAPVSTLAGAATPVPGVGPRTPWVPTPSDFGCVRRFKWDGNKMGSEPRPSYGERERGPKMAVIEIEGLVKEYRRIRGGGPPAVDPLAA